MHNGVLRVGLSCVFGRSGYWTAPVDELADTGVRAEVVDDPAEEGLVEAGVFGAYRIHGCVRANTEIGHLRGSAGNTKRPLPAENGPERPCLGSSEFRHSLLLPAGSLVGGSTHRHRGRLGLLGLCAAVS